MSNFFIFEYENAWSFLIQVPKSVGSVLLLLCWKSGELDIVYCMCIMTYVWLVLFMSALS